MVSISCFISCDTDDYQDPVFQAAADIYVRTIKMDDEVVHAPVVYAYSNLALFSTTVTLKGETDPRYDLDDTFEGANRLRKLPTTNEFTTTDIENGIYEFTITSAGNEMLKLKDELLDDRMDIMNITKFDYDSDAHKFDLEWDEIDEANVYVVKLMSAIDKNYLFASTKITKNSYSFSHSGAGWSSITTPKDGTTYILAVCAYKFESDNDTSGYDINHETIEYREIVW